MNMKMNMNRADALRLVRGHVAKESNVKHMVAVGAIMKELASRMGEDQDLWELTGILHDIDFEKCGGIEKHALLAKELLSGKVDDGVVEAIMAHNYEKTGVMPDSNLKRALVASDAASGLIVAAALVVPSRRLADVKEGSLMKKFRSKECARGCDRTSMCRSAELGFGIDEFMSIALCGMRKAAPELGL